MSSADSEGSVSRVRPADPGEPSRVIINAVIAGGPREAEDVTQEAGNLSVIP
jgi:hypothetical protein